MNGVVDNSDRALVHVRLKHPAEELEIDLNAWIDTAFSGDFVLSQQFIAKLNLPKGPIMGAVLADGSKVAIQTFSCLVWWFDEWKKAEVVANQGEIPLLGVGLLRKRQLLIDYRVRTVAIQ